MNPAPKNAELTPWCQAIRLIPIKPLGENRNMQNVPQKLRIRPSEELRVPIRCTEPKSKLSTPCKELTGPNNEENSLMDQQTKTYVKRPKTKPALPDFRISRSSSRKRSKSKNKKDDSVERTPKEKPAIPSLKYHGSDILNWDIEPWGSNVLSIIEEKKSAGGTRIENLHKIPTKSALAKRTTPSRQRDRKRSLPEALNGCLLAGLPQLPLNICEELSTNRSNSTVSSSASLGGTPTHKTKRKKKKSKTQNPNSSKGFRKSLTPHAGKKSAAQLNSMHHTMGFMGFSSPNDSALNLKETSVFSLRTLAMENAPQTRPRSCSKPEKVPRVSLHTPKVNWLENTGLKFSSFKQPLVQDQEIVAERDKLISQMRFKEDILQTPLVAGGDVEELASYLSSFAKSDVERAWAVFLWIALHIEQDEESFFGTKKKAQDASTVLQQQKAICSGYSNLFVSLCRRMGLVAEKILGSGKGADYRPATRIERANHEWVAVRLSGKWYLCDPMWGAGIMDSNRRFSRKLETFWFLTRPDHFIYKHWPLDARWQLLEAPIQFEEFEQMALLNPAYFKSGLELPASAKGGLLQAEHLLELRLRAPANVEIRASVRKVDSKASLVHGFAQRDGEAYLIYTLFPETKLYDLFIWSRRTNEQEDNWELAVQYSVQAITKKGLKHVRLPIKTERFEANECKLIEPLTNNFSTPSVVAFKIKVGNPQIHKVAVRTNESGQWHQLKSLGNGVWENCVSVEGLPLQVWVKPEDKPSYEAVLTYI